MFIPGEKVADTDTDANQNYVRNPKGAWLFLNEDVVAFELAAFEDVRKCYTDELHARSPGEVLAALVEQCSWTPFKDNFAKKAYKAMPYPLGRGVKGELRVTVAFQVKNDVKSLHVDIATWGPEGSFPPPFRRSGYRG